MHALFEYIYTSICRAGFLVFVTEEWVFICTSNDKAYIQLCGGIEIIGNLFMCVHVSSSNDDVSETGFH